MEDLKIRNHIVDWLNSYLINSGLDGFIIGVSGGVDSALTSTLCALTGKKTIVLNMPILQHKAEYDRACEHIKDLKQKFDNIESFEVDLTESFKIFIKSLPSNVTSDALAMANSRARLRMTTLYAIGQANKCLVVGTGNKVEDFGVGFYTKYGDGGVDLSPIADLTKSEVFELSAKIGVIKSILDAKPTDGLWEDGRCDEDQLGASYQELEWAMDFNGDVNKLTSRQKTVLGIYRKFNSINKHKMEPIPLCKIPKEYKN